MSVNWTRFPIAFDQGLETSADSKQLPAGKLVTLENGVFSSPGMLSKRNGLTSWTTRVEGGERFRSGSALAVHEDQLCLFTGDELYTRLNAVSKWKRVGKATSVVTRTEQLFGDSYEQTSPDVGLLSGVELYAYEDQRAGVRYSVLDSQTRATIVDDQLLTSTGQRPIVVSFAGQLVVLYCDGSSLQTRRVDALSPSSITIAAAIVNDVATGSYSHDALVVADRLFLAYGADDGTTKILSLNSSFSTVGSASLAGAHGPVTLFAGNDESLWCGWVSASYLMATNRNYALNAVGSGSLLIAPSFGADSAEILNLTGYSLTGSTANILYEVSADSESDHYVMVAPADVAATMAIVSGSVVSVSQSISASIVPYSDMSFKGVNLVGPEWGSALAAVPSQQYPGVGAGWTYWFPSTDDILYFKSQGFNTIRMAVQWERVQPLLNGPLSSSYWDPWKSVANQALSQSMNVVMVLRDRGARWVSGSYQHIGDGVLTWDHLANAWGKLANEWKHDTRVVFDIMNEPDFDLGGSDAGYTWLSASNAAIAAIRATGATNPIWVPGHAYNNAQGFSSNWDGSKPSDYLLHITSSAAPWYVTTHNYPEASHGDASSPISTDTILRTRAQNVVTWARANGKQVVFGEFAASGSYSTSSTMRQRLVIQDFMSFCEDNSDVVKGWCWWGAGMDYRNAHDPQSTFTESAYSISPIPHISLSGTRASQIDWMETWLSTTTGYVTSTFYITGSATGSSVVSTAGSPSVFARSVGLASKAFLHGRVPYVGVVHSSDLQGTHFTLDARDASVISKANAALAGGLREGRTLSNVPRISEGVFRYAATRKGRLVSEDSTLFAPTDVSSTELDFASTKRFADAPMAGELHVAGGVLGSFDGATFSEQNFHLYPETLTVVSSGSVGSITAGTRDYVAVYAWPNKQGVVHRSATSVPLTVVNNVTAAVTMSVPTLRLTAKEDVQVELYRTDNLGDVFYKVTSTTSPLFNTGFVDSVTFVDTLSDADLISREALYTIGGELEDFPAPACSLAITVDGRVWVAGLEDPNELRCSKQFTRGRGLAFNDALSVFVESKGGPITALGALDNLLVVFKRSSVYVVYGGTQNNTGQGQPYVAQLITTDVGCVEPNSVVVVNEGLMFLSEKGVYLLDKGRNVSPVGSPVQGVTSELTITSATVVPDDNQVRFTSLEGTTAVYDYLAKQWSTFTYPAAVDSIAWDGTFLLLRPDGRVAAEDPDTFTDDGAQVRLKLTTGWLSFGGLQGFARVRKLQLLGKYEGAHSLRVRFAYDFNPNASSEASIDASQLSTSTYGSDALYGDNVYGGEFPLYQFDVFPDRQKCTAIQVTIEDVQTGSYNEGVSLSNFAFEVGLKRGGNKLGPPRRAGAD